MNTQFIAYDEDAEDFYVWEAAFGTWDHRIITRARTLPELQVEYPFALVGEKAYKAWEHKTAKEKVGK